MQTLHQNEVEGEYGGRASTMGVDLCAGGIG